MQNVTNEAFLCAQNSVSFQMENTEFADRISIGLMLVLMPLISKDVSF